MYKLLTVWAFRSGWRQSSEDTESHPAVSSWRVTDHIKPILCVWSITLVMDADIIPYPGSCCLVALAVAGHCGLPTHFHRVKSNVTSLQTEWGWLKVLKGSIQKLCGDFEWYSIVTTVALWLPKPLIVRWCNRTYTNPVEFILMTIWALSDCLCLLVWSLARDDGEDTALRSRPKVIEGFVVYLTAHKFGSCSIHPKKTPRKPRTILHKL